MEIDQQEVTDFENDDQSTLFCPFCDKLFKNLGSYHVHLENHSDDDIGQTEGFLSDGKSWNCFCHVQFYIVHLRLDFTLWTVLGQMSWFVTILEPSCHVSTESNILTHN